jgi:hypothetical protein
MGQYAKGQTVRGYDVQLRLYKGGAPLDIIEAEELEGHPVLVQVDASPLSVGHTQHDTHQDGFDVVIKGVRKGNAFLKEVLAQVKRNRDTGKAFEKYTAVLKYKDINTGLTEDVKIVDATIMNLDPIMGGGTFSKSTEGCTLHGQLA